MSLSETQGPKPTKQRAACNRCHELKSRCTQSRIEPGTCDRCQRLGLPCAYSAKSPLGRPRSANTRRGNAPDSRVQARRNSDNRGGKGTRLDRLGSSPTDELTVSLLSDDCFASFTSDWQIDSSPAIDLDFSKLAHGQFDNQHHTPWTTKNLALGDASFISNLDTILDLPSSPAIYQDNPLDLMNLLSDDREPPGTPHAQNQVVGEGTATPVMRMTPSTADLCESPKAAPTPSPVANPSKPSTLKRLLDLQLQLQSISTSTPSSSVVAEVLLSVRTLTKILSDVAMQRPASGSSHSESQDPRSASQTLAGDDSLVILHVLTCYMYLLHMFEPMVLSLERQCRGAANEGVLTPALSLGSFSLASQPELNVQVTLNLIHLMFKRLHHSVQALKLENSRLLGSMVGSGDDEGSGERGKMGSSMVDAALVGVESLHRIEAAVLRKLESSGRDRIMEEH